MMSSQSHSDPHEIAIEILTYLLNNPDSQDTLEGIVQWWLLEIHIRRQIALVRQALSELIDKDFVVEINRFHSQVSYQINKSKLREIEQLVKRKR